MDIIVLKSIFLRYILLPLFVIILAIVLGYLKKQLPKVKGKVIVVYVLVASFCLAIPGLLGFTGNMFNPYWYLFATLLYLGLGILQVNVLNNYVNDTEKPVWFMVLFESLITLTSMLLGGYLFYLIFNWVSPFQGYGFMAATSITIFILPLLFYYSYIQFISIPFDIYKTWSNAGEHVIVDFAKLDFKTLLVLNLELTKTITDGKKSRIDAKAPSDGISVGDWFYRLVDDYNHKYSNSPIHLFDEARTPYSWIFYTKKSIFHFRRFIDFDNTMAENNITKHSTIICKRVINNEIEGQIINK